MISKWVAIPIIISLVFFLKAFPKSREYTSGNFSDYQVDNIIRLLWLIPLEFVWIIYLLFQGA